jgi:hypothetical protein
MPCEKGMKNNNNSNPQSKNYHKINKINRTLTKNTLIGSDYYRIRGLDKEPKDFVTATVS